MTSAKYSPRSARALAFLKRRYNQIDIFVEDTGSPNMWKLLISSMIPGVRLESVNMLGGRRSVVDACRLDQADDDRRKLYIIDGDLDFLLGKRRPNLRFLYRIRGYCIENLILTEGALVAVGMESQPQESEENISNNIEFPALEREIVRILGPLFIVYAVAHRLVPSLRTVAFSVSGLIAADNRGAVLDEAKVRARTRHVAREVVSRVGMRRFGEMRRLVSRRATQIDLARMVSGKDYLLPLIWMRLRARCKYPGNKEQMKVSLARNFDPSIEPWFARRVRALAA